MMKFVLILSTAYAIIQLGNCQGGCGPVTSFYDFGSCANDGTFYGDEGNVYVSLASTGSFIYGGTAWNALYVRTNGIISFGQNYGSWSELTSIPITSPGPAFVAPFWIDNNIGSAAGGTVYYRNVPASETDTFARVNAELDSQHSGFTATTVFIATWYQATGWGISSTMTNNVQAILATDGVEVSYAIFLYDQIQYTYALSQSAYAGWDLGNGINYFSLPDSGTNAISNLETSSNVGENGKWILQLHTIPKGKATYKCVDTDTTQTTGSGGEQIEITGPNEFSGITYRRLFVKNEYDSSAACRTTTVVDGNFVLQVPFGVSPCRTTLQGSTGTMTFILAQSLDFIQDTDVQFTVGAQCDYSQAPTQQVSTTGVSVGDLSQAGQADYKQETVQLDIVQDNNNALDLDSNNNPACSLGQDVKLQLTLTKSSSAKGLYGIECNAYPSESAVTAGSPTLSMISSSCAVDSSANGFSSGLPSSTGFGDSRTGNDAQTTGSFVSRTGTFKCFQFNGASLLVIQCTVGFCVDAEAQPCNADNCQSLSARRRRDVRNKTESVEPVEENVIVKVAVRNTPFHNQAKANANGYCKTVYDPAYLPLIIAMACLLLLAIVTSVFLGCRLARARRDNIKNGGVDNPAF